MQNLTKLIFLLFSFLIIIQGDSIKIFSQSISDADVEESDRRKKLAENEKAIAEAQKAELDAKFPKPDAGSLVGGTTVKGDFIEAKMLGYCAMKTAAKSLAGKIVPATFPAGSKFIVYNEADVKMLSRYQLMNQRLVYLKSAYDSLCPAGAANPCGGGFQIQALGIGLAANKALEFLSLLKTDIDITGTEVNIGEKEVVAEVFNNLPAYKLYYPQRIPLSATNFVAGGAVNSTLFNNIISLGQAYDLARNLKPVAPATNVPARDRLDQLYNSTMKELGLGDAPPTTSAGGGGGALPVCPGGCSQTTNVNVNVGDKEKEESGGSGGSDKTFFSYLQAEKLYDIMTLGGSYWLDLQVVKAGGNMRVKSNFITNFMIGSRVNFSGGAIVYFNVFDKDGISKLSGVVPAYENYRKSSKINETCGEVKN